MALLLELVPHPAYIHDVLWARGIRLNLLAQAVDVPLDDLPRLVQIVRLILPHHPYEFRRWNNPVAVLFGPEDRGLTNVDIRFCDILVNIPTAEFSSLNLAQAVMIMCYELHSFSRDKPGEFAPRLANRRELEEMYVQLKDVLMRISFINPDNPDYFMNNLRHFFSRMQLRAKEVSIIRGICRQIDWYGKKCYRDGLETKKKDAAD